MKSSALLLSASLFVGALLPTIGAAQVVVASTVPQTGTSQPISPEPAVARPSTTPCVVSLFSNLPFNDYGTRTLSFTPPSGCTGPWSKVVLTADITVTAGRQFDRTAKFFLGGADIYFGTTAEPRAALSPSWHIERDLTDYSALFTVPQVGVASIQNVVNSTYTGLIYGSATLLFYPANAANLAPAVPSVVLPLANNTTTRVSSTTDQQAATFTLPRNVTRAYLDVISQSQSTDEFWYTCVPNDVAGPLENCGNSAFRETEITIDGVPAGVAPVYPWIYTGGIDPYLWEPLPGVETLNFKPYRVDLTPFAGLLSDGTPHTVAVSVFNADSGFDEASTLLLYTDPNAATVSGGITVNTLAALPTPQIDQALNTAADGTVSGPVNVRSQRAWTISGYVMTSSGRVDTTLQASNSFSNLQDEKVSDNSNIYKQNLSQDTEQQELVTTTSASGTIQTQHNASYPLVILYNQTPDDNNDGGFYIANYVKQQKFDTLRTPFGGNSTPVTSTEVVESSDTLRYSAAGSLLGHDTNHTTSTYGAKDAQGNCIYRGLTADQLILTQVNDSTSCSLVP